MNCQEVQSQLSDYLEKSLDGANLKTIETHLSSCLVCRAEVDNLTECIDQVSALTIIDPPIGFTQRVMARVRETEITPSFWQRLFFPLQIKIPIQATAVVLLGIFAVYLFEKEQREPLPMSAPGVAVDQTTASAPASTPDNQFSQVDREKGGAGSDTRPLKDASAPLRKDAPAIQTKMAFGEMGETRSASKERNEVDLPSAPPSELRGKTGTIIGTPIKNYTIPAPFSPAELERPGPIEPFADYELVLRRNPLPQDQSRRDTQAQRKLDAGPAADLQSAPRSLDRLLSAVPDPTTPQTVWLTLPQSQYEQFKRDLRAVGTIESETFVPLFRKESPSQGDGQLQIKLTVNPAAETNRSGPASGSDR